MNKSRALQLEVGVVKSEVSGGVLSSEWRVSLEMESESGVESKFGNI